MSNETLRNKAKYRLVGSVVLVLLGVMGFTFMLDTQPRPKANDVTVLIPARDKLPPLALAPAASSTGHGAGVASGTPVTPALPSNASSAPISTLSPSSTAVGAVRPTVNATPLQEEPVSKPLAHKPAASGALAAVAADALTDKGRFILQVGAFVDVQKAREARMKLERGGIKTYTQVIPHPEGRRIRVRVGPFDKRVDAEKVAAKIRALDLPVVLLTL